MCLGGDISLAGVEFLQKRTRTQFCRLGNPKVVVIAQRYGLDLLGGGRKNHKESISVTHREIHVVFIIYFNVHLKLQKESLNIALVVFTLGIR